MPFASFDLLEHVAGLYISDRPRPEADRYELGIQFNQDGLFVAGVFKNGKLLLKESDLVLKHEDPFFDLELSRVKYRVDKEGTRVFGELDTEN